MFWDTEIFMLPFFILTQPDTARALLRYRYHTLDGARANSREYGTGGARYAWESADTGREDAPKWTADGANRFWTGEEEIHVSADVAYGLLGYVEATGDTAFLHDLGAEILFETSRFWVDRVEPAAEATGTSSGQVMGPDEFHSHVDNNAFTNRLAQWHLPQAAALYDELRDRHPEALAALVSTIGLDSEERDRWHEVADGLVAARYRDGVIEQFTGYFERETCPSPSGTRTTCRTTRRATTTTTARTPTAQAARRGHADLPAARRVQRRGQAGELRVLRGRGRCTSRR